MGKFSRTTSYLTNGPVNVIAKIVVAGGDVLLHRVSFYPLTSAKLELGVGDVLRIFRSISDQAKEEGFLTCSVEAYRSGGARPGRMMNLTRRLR
jgi:hypothetical protein